MINFVRNRTSRCGVENLVKLLAAVEQPGAQKVSRGSVERWSSGIAPSRTSRWEISPAIVAMTQINVIRLRRHNSISRLSLFVQRVSAFGQINVKPREKS
jgi:hypothetical protein